MKRISDHGLQWQRFKLLCHLAVRPREFHSKVERKVSCRKVRAAASTSGEARDKPISVEKSKEYKVAQGMGGAELKSVDELAPSSLQNVGQSPQVKPPGATQPPSARRIERPQENFLRCGEPEFWRRASGGE